MAPLLKIMLPEILWKGCSIDWIVGFAFFMLLESILSHFKNHIASGGCTPRPPKFYLILWSYSTIIQVAPLHVRSRIVTAYTEDIWTVKASCNTGYCQLRHSPTPETAIPAFHITMNSPLLESASSR